MTTYETLCASNKSLYGQLEACTVQLQQLDPIYHEAEYNEVARQRQAIAFEIDHNLDAIEALWNFAPEVGVGLKRYAARDLEEMTYKDSFSDIISLYVKNPNLTQKDIAAEVGVKAYQVSRAITSYLVTKYS